MRSTPSKTSGRTSPSRQSATEFLDASTSGVPHSGHRRASRDERAAQAEQLLVSDFYGGDLIARFIRHQGSRTLVVVSVASDSWWPATDACRPAMQLAAEEVPVAASVQESDRAPIRISFTHAPDDGIEVIQRIWATPPAISPPAIIQAVASPQPVMHRETGSRLREGIGVGWKEGLSFEVRGEQFQKQSSPTGTAPAISHPVSQPLGPLSDYGKLNAEKISKSLLADNPYSY